MSIQDERINSYLGKIDDLESTAGLERGSSLKELEGQQFDSHVCQSALTDQIRLDEQRCRYAGFMN